jgi:hypothetical protein
VLPPDPGATLERVRAARRRQQFWVIGLSALALLVVVLAAVTISVSVGGKSSPSRRSNGSGASNSSSGTNRTTTTAPSGPGPHITALSPSSGPAGQVVTITGVNLVSADGQVLASFGGTVAPTSCSSATTCTATAPAAPNGSAKVPVTVKTSEGTSNSLDYTYR